MWALKSSRLLNNFENYILFILVCLPTLNLLLSEFFFPSFEKHWKKRQIFLYEKSNFSLIWSRNLMQNFNPVYFDWSLLLLMKKRGFDLALIIIKWRANHKLRPLVMKETSKKHLIKRLKMISFLFYVWFAKKIDNI